MNIFSNFRNRFSKHDNTFWGSRWWYFFILSFLSVLITIPLFIIVYRYFPDMVFDFGVVIRIDHILCFSLVFLVIFTLFRLVNKKLMLSLSFSMMIVLFFLQLFNVFTFSDLIKSYGQLVHFVEDNPVELPLLPESKLTIRNASLIKKAVDYENPELRDFAVKAAVTWFTKPEYYHKYGNVIRYFSVFKVINNWKYVPDPLRFDYFAKASESAKLLAGDCDDHAILMAACIKAIGGEVRLIHTKNHLYPEVKVGKIKDLPAIYHLIKKELFYKESLGKKLYYHIDNEGNIWLNFDYTGHYPGARFMHEKIIGILIV